MMFRLMPRHLAAMLVAVGLTAGCAVIPAPPQPPQPPPTRGPSVVRVTVRNAAGDVLAARGTLWDDAGHQLACDPGVRLACTVPEATADGWQVHLGVSADGYDYAEQAWVLVRPGPMGGSIDLPDWILTSLAPPVGPKAEFWMNYQGNFGSIKLSGCGLHLDSLFDPYLLIRWLDNRPCFEQMMQAHAARGDNRVAVDPRSGYHGYGDVDLWHDPATFDAFLRDVRTHVNNRGEHFKTLVFLSADEHIPEMRAQANYDHWRRDVDALAAAAAGNIDATVVCWECRHQNDYTSAKRYVDMGRYVAAAFPQAVHAQHLIADSSSWSSWRCDPQIPGSCKDPNDGPDPGDADDPNRGNETNAWINCRREGWCDLFLFQFQIGSAYVSPTPGDDAKERWVEIAERLGDDPRSLAASGGNHHGWPQVPILAFEFIYDAYWNRGADEALGLTRCREYLAIGGWGCGSASVRP